MITYKWYVGYAPLGLGRMSYCKQTSFPLRKGGVWHETICDYEIFLTTKISRFTVLGFESHCIVTTIDP